jgi:hypothetical protein
MENTRNSTGGVLTPFLSKSRKCGFKGKRKNVDKGI